MTSCTFGVLSSEGSPRGPTELYMYASPWLSWPLSVYVSVRPTDTASGGRGNKGYRPARCYYFCQPAIRMWDLNIYQRCFKQTCLESDSSRAVRNDVLSPFLTGRMFVRPNILRTLRRTMIRFLIEHLVRRIWFGQSKLYFILIWLVMRCKLRPELAADAQQTAWSKNVG